MRSIDAVVRGGCSVSVSASFPFALFPSFTLIHAWFFLAIRHYAPQTGEKAFVTGRLTVDLFDREVKVVRWL